MQKSLGKIKTPSYVCEEELLESNLKLLGEIQNRTGVKILLALKGFALFSTFELVGKYLHGTAASGLYEARLGYEQMGKEVHTYSPAFKDEQIDEILQISNHVIFNSFDQWRHFKSRALRAGVSCGLRVNPEISSSPVPLYDPCAPFSRLGITHTNFEFNNISGIEGLHFHALCEQNADALEEVLNGFESQYAHILNSLKWVNFGGGHHITRDDYNVETLISLLKNFKSRYPHLEIYLEPGEAVGWQSGVLISSVIDIVHNGIDIAILDVSAEAHMPDVLAMPYRPDVRGASKAGEKPHTYRLGGNSCLAGDIIGDYSFNKALEIGQKIVFEDMIHYTMVKNTTFNGVELPSIVVIRKSGKIDVVREFGYEDYKTRLS